MTKSEYKSKPFQNIYKRREMTSIRLFNCADFFKYNFVELSDQPRSLGCTSLNIYLEWLAEFPEYSFVAESPNGDVMGFIMGIEVEDDYAFKYSNVCLLVCSSVHRRIGIGTQLLKSFENVSKQKKQCLVSLYVQVVNSAAIELYRKLGFEVINCVPDYYDEILEKEAYLMEKRLV